MLINSGPTAPGDFLRLPGRGGAGLFLRASWAAAGWLDLDVSGLVLDIGLLDPHRYVQFRARPCSLGSLERLSEFLFAAACEQHPEQTLADFNDGRLGLGLSIVQSTEFEVTIEVLVVEDVGADVIEHDGLNFQTTRAALVSAAQRALTLDEVPHAVNVDVW